MNKQILTKTLLTVSICAATAQANATTTRIIGGTQAQSGAYPWMVSLQGGGQHFCGASMVAKDWVLTAAHCVEGESAGSVQAMIGEYDLTNNSDGGQQRAISQIIIHPKRQSSSNDHDIALLKLKSPVTGTPVQSATPAIMQGIEAGKLLTVMGWGNQSTSGEQFPNTLFEVQVPLVSNTSCGNYQPGEITSNMICAGFPQGGKDSCQGDSGGPLLYQLDGQWHQLGIVSFGQGCAEAGYPGVYARVASYSDWIAGHLSGTDTGNTGGDTGGTDTGDTSGGDTGGTDTGDTGTDGGNTDSGNDGGTTDPGNDVDLGDWVDDEDWGDWGDEAGGYDVGSQDPEIFNLPWYVDIFSMEGNAEEAIVLLENMTDKAVKITGITSDSEQFTIDGNTCSTLQPGASCAASVTYTPAANQDYSFGALTIALEGGESVVLELYGENLSAFEDNFDWDEGFDWFSDDDYWSAEGDELGLFGNAIRKGGRAVMSAQVTGPGTLEFNLLLPNDLPENSVSYLVDGKPVRTITGARKKALQHRTELSAGKHTISWVYNKQKETEGQVKVSKMKFTRSTNNFTAGNGGGGSSDLGFLAALLLVVGGVRTFFGRK